MWISPGRGGWLAVVALALGTTTAEGAGVTFRETDFEGDHGNKREAIFDPAVRRTFTWTADGVTVSQIHLCTVDSRGFESPIASRRRDSLPDYDLSQSDGALVPSVGTARTATAPTTTAAAAAAAAATAASSTTTTEFTRMPTPDTPVGDVRLLPRQGSIRGGSDLRLEVVWLQWGGNVSIVNPPVVDYDVSLVLKAEWDRGVSYSRLFVFATADDLVFRDRELYTITTPYDPQNIIPVSGTSTSSGPSSHTSDVRGIEPEGNAGKSSGGDSDSGLSTSATIGIAVAVGVAVLATIFTLVWCLLRRRQKTRDKKDATFPAGPYGSGNRAEELMAEKEAAAAAVASTSAADVDGDVPPHSPHSPYSDDGAGAGPASGSPYRDTMTTTATATSETPLAAPAAHTLPPHHHHHQHQQQSQFPPPHDQQPQPFTSYSDRPGGAPSVPTASIAPADEARATSVPSPTPRALTTPYAHLIEEGMTEEEIRRLEEEERQLDAAIEQAGRR